MTEDILGSLRLLFWTILLCCHSSGLHLEPFHSAAQWCELDWHWYCTSSWWPLKLHAILCQRLFWNQWRRGTDSADIGGTLSQGSKVADLIDGASSGSEPNLFFSNYFFSLGFQPIQDEFQHDFARMTDEADSSVVLAELQVTLFRECNNQRLSPWGRSFSVR